MLRHRCPSFDQAISFLHTLGFEKSKEILGERKMKAGRSFEKDYLSDPDQSDLSSINEHINRLDSLCVGGTSFKPDTALKLKYKDEVFGGRHNLGRKAKEKHQLWTEWAKEFDGRPVAGPAGEETNKPPASPIQTEATSSDTVSTSLGQESKNLKVPKRRKISFPPQSSIAPHRREQRVPHHKWEKLMAELKKEDPVKYNELVYGYFADWYVTKKAEQYWRNANWPPEKLEGLVLEYAKGAFCGKDVQGGAKVSKALKALREVHPRT